MRTPIISALPASWTLAPSWARWGGVSPCTSRLIARLGQQEVPVHDRPGHVDHPPAAGAGVLAQEVERLALGDRVALHEDALRALDHGPALERALELLDLLAQRPRLGVAAHRHLERAPDRLGRGPPGVGEDAALSRAGDELGVLAVQEGDDRTGGVLAELLDQLERVLVVLVDDDDRDVGLVLGDDAPGLGDRDGARGDLVPQLAQQRRRALQRLLVLIRREDLQPAPRVGSVAPQFALLESGRSSPAPRLSSQVGAGPDPCRIPHLTRPSAPAPFSRRRAP